MSDTILHNASHMYVWLYMVCRYVFTYVDMYVCINVSSKKPNFDFPKFFTNIPHDDLLHVLNETIDFAFKDVTSDYVTVYNLGAF